MKIVGHSKFTDFSRRLQRENLSKQRQREKAPLTILINVGFPQIAGISRENDTEAIPPLTHISPHSLSIKNQHKIIFDLETGALGIDTDITQISAVSFESEDAFEQYVTPIKPISAPASAATGLQNHGGVLIKEGELVPKLSIKQALLPFIDRLSDRGPCILIAQNSKFDSKHLIHHIFNSNLVS